jgi:hypothetical protein
MQEPTKAIRELRDRRPVWDLEKRQELKTVNKGYGWFALSPDGKIMAVTDHREEDGWRD